MYYTVHLKYSKHLKGLLTVDGVLDPYGMDLKV